MIIHYVLIFNLYILFYTKVNMYNPVQSPIAVSLKLLAGQIKFCLLRLFHGLNTRGVILVGYKQLQG
jgi:hypothetical protein